MSTSPYDQCSCPDDGWENEIDWIDWVTQTTPAPCTGECVWNYNSVTRQWVRQSTSCSTGCNCSAPQWCPGFESVCYRTRTQCHRNTAVPTPTCPDPADTSTTTTTPAPSCTGGPCEWDTITTTILQSDASVIDGEYLRTVPVWNLVTRNGCPEECNCAPGGSRIVDIYGQEWIAAPDYCQETDIDCGDGATTTTSTTPCPSPCGWRCLKIYTDEGIIFRWVVDQAPPGADCGSPPSELCDASTPCDGIVWLVADGDGEPTPYLGAGDANPRSSQCCGNCVFSWSEDLGQWDVVEYCPGCDCAAPSYDGETNCDVVETPCLDKTTTTTTTTTTPLWYCVCPNTYTGVSTCVTEVGEDDVLMGGPYATEGDCDLDCGDSCTTTTTTTTTTLEWMCVECQNHDSGGDPTGDPFAYCGQVNFEVGDVFFVGTGGGTYDACEVTGGPYADEPACELVCDTSTTTTTTSPWYCVCPLGSSDPSFCTQDPGVDDINLGGPYATEGDCEPECAFACTTTTTTADWYCVCPLGSNDPASCTQSPGVDDIVFGTFPTEEDCQPECGFDCFAWVCVCREGEDFSFCTQTPLPGDQEVGAFTTEGECLAECGGECSTTTTTTTQSWYCVVPNAATAYCVENDPGGEPVYGGVYPNSSACNTACLRHYCVWEDYPDNTLVTCVHEAYLSLGQEEVISGPYPNDIDCIGSCAPV